MPGEVQVTPSPGSFQVAGTLEMVRDFGFLRKTEVGDVYIAPSQVQACRLQPGQQVAGIARENHRGDGWTMVHIEAVEVLPPTTRETTERLLLAALVDYAWAPDTEPTVREAKALAAYLAKVVAP